MQAAAPGYHRLGIVSEPNRCAIMVRSGRCSSSPAGVNPAYTLLNTLELSSGQLVMMSARPIAGRTKHVRLGAIAHGGVAVTAGYLLILHSTVHAPSGPIPPRSWQGCWSVVCGFERLLAAVGCVMVLVGHCTLKDCEITGNTAAHTDTDTSSTFAAYLLDIRLLLLSSRSSIATLRTG
jgi:hypothetical protein